jgi:hypothetical protein
MPAHRTGRLARPTRTADAPPAAPPAAPSAAPPDPRTAALELLLRVLADLEAGDGVLIWLLDATGRLRGLLAGPPTWPIDDEVTDLLIEHALDDDDAAAVIVVRRRGGSAGLDPADQAGFDAFDAACARVDLPVLWHLVDAGGAVRVRELR